MSRTIRYKLSSYEEQAVLAVVNALNKEGYQTDIQDFGRAALLEATQKIIDNSKSGVKQTKGMSIDQAKAEQAAVQALVAESVTEEGAENAEPGIQESGTDVQGSPQAEIQSTEEG